MLVLALLLAAWAVVAAHRRDTRGIGDDFPAPVRGADVPALGVNVPLAEYDSVELATVLDRIANDGFVWVRGSFYWSTIEPNPGEFDWSVADRVISALRRRPELQLIAVLEDDPPAPPEDASRFAAFAGAFAARYGDDVAAYQIWDEPNLGANWGGGPANPPAYADLLVRSSDAIRMADPGARILLAGLAPTTETGPQNLSELRYLEQLYVAGTAPSFDVVAGKAYGFDTGPGDRRVDESVLNFSRLLLLREVMVEHGDGDKAIWVSHWGWNALPDGWTGPPSIWGETDELTQASWSTQALQRVRKEWPWVGATVIENLQTAGSLDTAGESRRDDPRWGFSLLRPDGSARPVYTALTEWVGALQDAAPVGGYPADNAWAEYEGSWRLGPVGADPVLGAVVPTEPDLALEQGENRAVFRFEGTSVAVTVRRGPYPGFIAVTVDSEPANRLPRDEDGRAYLVLYDDEPGMATVELAEGLEPGVHTVEVAIAGAEGRWPLVDWRVGAAPVPGAPIGRFIGLVLATVASGALLVREAWRIDWGAWAQRFLAGPDWSQTGMIVGCAALFWFAAALTWGRSPFPALASTAGLLVSLCTLPVLALLFAARLDLGLALVAFSAPFYLVPERMLYRALALPEILVLLCAVAYVIDPLGDASPIPNLSGLSRGSGKAGRVSGGIRFLHLLRREVTGTDWAVGLLVIAALLAGAAADDRLAALFELRTVFLLPALYYALLRLVPMDGPRRRQIADSLILGGLSVALIGLGQMMLGRGLVMAEGGLPRLTSVYRSPNSAALYLGRVWPFLVAVGLMGQGRRRRLYGLALLPVTAAMTLSFSRGALLLGLPAAVLMMGWLAGGRFRWIAGAVIVMGVLGLLPLLRLPRFAALFDLEQGTTFFRLKLWRSSLQMIRDHPVFGVGPGNFAAAYRTRYVLPAAWQEFNLEHPHSILLDFWTRLGVLGLAAGAAMQLGFWRMVRRKYRSDPLALGLAGAMAALLAHGLVDNAVFFPDLALVLAVMLALVGGSES